MPPVAVDDVVEVRLIQELDSQTIMNVLHYAVTSGAATSYDAMTTALNAKFATPATGLYACLTACQSENAELRFMEAQVIKPVRFYVRSHAVGTAGNVPEAAVPTSTAVQVVKQGTIAGKGRTGHFALGAAPDSLIEDSEISVGMADLLQTKLMPALGEVLSVGGVTLTPIISPAKISGQWNFLRSLYAIREVRTQKRRVVRRGV